MHTSDTQRLTDALVLWGATASQIVAHMQESEASGRSTATEPVVAVFTRLVHDELVAAVGDHADLHIVAEVVETVDRSVGENIFMVAPPSNRAERRARRRGRPCG